MLLRNSGGNTISCRGGSRDDFAESMTGATSIFLVFFGFGAFTGRTLCLKSSGWACFLDVLLLLVFDLDFFGIDGSGLCSEKDPYRGPGHWLHVVGGSKSNRKSGDTSSLRRSCPKWTMASATVGLSPGGLVSDWSWSTAESMMCSS